MWGAGDHVLHIGSFGCSGCVYFLMVICGMLCPSSCLQASMENVHRSPSNQHLDGALYCDRERYIYIIELKG